MSRPTAVRTTPLRLRSRPSGHAPLAAMALWLAVAAGCAGAGGTAGPTAAAAGGPPRAATVDVASPGAGSEGNPFEVVGALNLEPLPDAVPVLTVRKLALPPAAAGVPPRPAHCEAFVRRTPAKELRCTDRPSALEAIAQALGEADEARRDARLLDLESCTALPSGLIRSLRAELAPIECADGLVDTLALAPPADIDPLVHDALSGYALAARLARTVQSPPKLEPPFDRKRVEQFHAGPVAQWGRTTATAIQDLAQRAATLGFYGKAVAAVEAGMADMRFVEAVRGVPLPDELAKDRELADTYYQTLDGALGPRKDRGRDAALAGLRGFALLGAIRDARITQARTLLSKMYGGRPIDALDPLLLPALAVPPPTTLEARLAASLPTFYAGLLLEPAHALEPAVLGALMARGVPLAHRIALRKAALSPELRLLYARARVDLGRAHWRAADFDEATSLLTAEPKIESEGARFLLALALALRGGPVDATTMIRRAPIESLGIGRVGALDAIAVGSGGVADPPTRALAAFDAAVLLQLAAPPEASPDYWKALRGRFERAAAMLSDRTAQAAAAERAREAADVAKAIRPPVTAAPR